MAARSEGGKPDPAEGLRIELLGRFRVHIGARVIDDAAWRLQRARTLVQVLALAPRYRLHREQLVEVLWPDRRLAAAANSLNQVLYVARRVLALDQESAAGYLEITGDVVCLSDHSAPWVDVDAFKAASTTARARRDLAAYRAAIACYTGDLLPENLYAEWAEEHRLALRQEYNALLIDAADLHRDDDPAWLLAALHRLLDLDPTHEEAHAALMRLYAQAGETHRALRQYDLLVQALRRDLDVAPQQWTQLLRADIHAGRIMTRIVAMPGAKAPAVAPPHHLPPRPDALQVGGPAPAAPRSNLPLQLNSFVGRGREQAEIARLLTTTRLLTLAGAGGCGKTRLALHVAEALLPDFPDGVWLIELAAMRQPSLVPQAIASALGITERAGAPLVETLSAALRTRRLLLVLDNCEHQVDACAQVAGVLLGACPRLHILATSREPLHIPGEVIWRVSSLSVPDPERLAPPDELGAYEAVRLFVDRAKAVVPSFALTAANAPAVARICYRLDGIPLALELAAARLAVLPVEGIAARLGDLFRLLTGGSRTALSRQQTLKALLDWSHDLLSTQERLALRRLAVFAGGFDLEAAEAVLVDDTSPTADVFEVLNGLVDKSLLQVETQGDSARYRLLEPVRQYAALHLGTSGEGVSTSNRHREWYTRLTEQADAALWGAQHRVRLLRLETEYDNIRAALAWCVHHGDQAAGQRLAGALWQFWLLRGYMSEGRRWLQDLLAGASEPSALRAMAFLHVYTLATRQGDSTTTTTAFVKQSVDIFRGLGDLPGQSQAMRHLGIQSYLRGEYAEARACVEQSAAMANAATLAVERALAIQALGVLDWAQGDYGAARRRFEESLALFRQAEPGRRISLSFLNMPLIELPYGDVLRALTWQVETWVLLRGVDAEMAAGYTLACLGVLARLDGAPEHAYLAESVEVFSRIGDQAGLSQALNLQGSLYAGSHAFSPAWECFQESLSLRRALGERRGIGRTLNNMGMAALLAGRPDQARELLSESAALFSAMGDRPGIWATRQNEAHLALLTGEFAMARTIYTECRGLTREMGDLKRPASFEYRHLGLAARAQGDIAGARSAFAAGLALAREMEDRASSATLSALLDALG